MKKTLLLSVVASSMIMAGGDIAPVEPMVVEPVVEASGWDFSGQAVVYYQTMDELDRLNTGPDLFDQTGATASAGIQLRAVNKDVFYGIGAGVEVNGVATLGLENDIVSNVMQSANGDIRGGWISQAYLTYGFGNTSIKAGRQELPKALSPFAFSEGWNVFKNTFDAALIVNTDISNTTLVGAWVESANFNNVASDMANFDKVNGGAGVYMLTAQNKSIDALTLTGSYYYGASTNSDTTFGQDLNILWASASYGGFEGFNVAGQIGTVMSDDFTVTNNFANDDDTIAYGVKVGGNFSMIDFALIYTGVDDSGYGVFNVGGVKTPLYSQLILNQGALYRDNDTFVAKAGIKALGGKFGLAYNYSDLGDFAYAGTALGGRTGAGTYSELDLTFKTKVYNDSTTLFAGYIYQDDTRDAVLTQNGNVLLEEDSNSQNTIRVWGRYNF